MSSSKLLKFQETIAESICDPGSSDLLVLARGLGLRKIICTLLKRYASPEKLVVLVGANEVDEDVGIGSQLSTMGVRNPGLQILNHETDSKYRQEIYKKGGLVSVTLRILIVDLLVGDLPASLISGLMVMHAEKVSPSSPEAFIIRLYRKTNSIGFLKAFSDQPEYFTTGMFPLQTIMKELHLRNVHIFPRFHQTVQEDLQRRKADIIELHQALNQPMRDIHDSIIQCISGTLGQLKRSNSTLDLEDIKIENTYFRSFDSLVRRQLDPVWHKVGPQTKKLVRDLAQLRHLLTYLLSYDPFTFLEYLEYVRDTNVLVTPGTSKASKSQYMSPWLMTDAANVIFAAARNRCYIQNKPPKQQESDASAREDRWDDEDAWEVLDEMEGRTPAPRQKPVKVEAEGWKPWMPSGMQPVLEELPKWKILVDVLDEIEQTMSANPAPFYAPGSNVTLIMAADHQTCTIIRDFLSSARSDPSSPGRELLEGKLRLYLLHKMHARDGDESKSKSRPSSTPKPSAQVSEAMKRKDNARVVANRNRRRVRGGAPGSSSGRSDPSKPLGDAANPLDVDADDLDDFLASQSELALIDDLVIKNEPTQAELLAMAQDLAGINILQPDGDNGFDGDYGIIQPEQLIVVRPYGDDADDMLLAELRPRWVVMYDPNQDFLRRIEVYRAMHPGLALRIYFMNHHETSEEQKFLVGIRREKEAFERLISERGKMHLVIDAEASAYSGTTENILAALSTRNAGGQKNVSSQQSTVLVDLREFRSKLPNLLDKAGQLVVPLTLTVGDYILAPDICVERKSLDDLDKSFANGRLYSQCELMSVHYKQPVLLIEFEENKSFSLQAITDAKAAAQKYADPGKRRKEQPEQQSTLRIDPQAIQTRLVILTLAFPRLRIIWSASPYATATTFADLKANHPEPDPLTAVAKGNDDGGQDGGGGVASANPLAEEVLRSLPGVGTKNYRYVMGKVGSLRELCEMDLKAVQVLLGVGPGKACYEFLHKGERQPAVAAGSESAQ